MSAWPQKRESTGQVGSAAFDRMPVFHPPKTEGVDSCAMNSPIVSGLPSSRCHPTSRAARQAARSGKSPRFAHSLSSTSEKHKSFGASPKSALSCPHSVPLRGRIAIVTDVGYGMRWTRAGRSVCFTRGRTAGLRTRNRVVLASRC